MRAKSGPATTSLVFLVAWVALNAFDTLETWLLLSGGSTEGNVLVAGLVGSLGLHQAMVVKLIAGVAIGWFLWPRIRPTLWWWLDGAMAGVVAWNLLVMGLWS